VFDVLLLHQRKRRVTPDDLLEKHLKLQPGQGRTDAKVPTLAEGDMLASIRPPDVEAVGLGEQLRIIVGRAWRWREWRLPAPPSPLGSCAASTQPRRQSAALLRGRQE